MIWCDLLVEEAYFISQEAGVFFSVLHLFSEA